MKWIRDELFIRGNFPMTKFNIRILTLGYLALDRGDRFLDIGAGTGSISIEAALHGAKVWAIEREREGTRLIRANSEKIGVDLTIIHGQAPEGLPDGRFDKCFIGGSGGKLEEILAYLEKALVEDGIVVGNFITLRNLNKFMDLLRHYNYRDVEVNLVQVSTMDRAGLLKGQNPIFLVKGVKANG